MSERRSGAALSRRTVLTSLSLGTLALMAGISCTNRPRVREFGLAASGIDAAAVEQSRAAAELLGKKLNVLCIYDAFAWSQPLPTALLDLIHAAGAVPEITWEPWNPERGPIQPLYASNQIAGGRYDSYVAGWATQAAAYDRRILIRFAHEMNGNWYPWSVESPGSSADDYVAAYRRVRRIFDDAGAHQVEWVWSPNVIINNNVDSIARAYPGDDFVDIVGVDGYNFGNDNGHHWTSPEDLFGPTLTLLASLSSARPVWITEVGCSDRGGDKALWITDFGRYLLSTDVSGLVWFEADKPGEPDWRLTSTPRTTAAARAALAEW